jgi:hypothetical protein
LVLLLFFPFSLQEDHPAIKCIPSVGISVLIAVIRKGLSSKNMRDFSRRREESKCARRPTPNQATPYVGIAGINFLLHSFRQP